MRENRTHGSEGGESGLNRTSLPLSVGDCLRLSPSFRSADLLHAEGVLHHSPGSRSASGVGGPTGHARPKVLDRGPVGWRRPRLVCGAWVGNTGCTAHAIAERSATVGTHAIGDCRRVSVPGRFWRPAGVSRPSGGTALWRAMVWAGRCGSEAILAARRDRIGHPTPPNLPSVSASFSTDEGAKRPFRLFFVASESKSLQSDGRCGNDSSVGMGNASMSNGLERAMQSGAPDARRLWL